jgi:enoyl-CoA hydratase/carnithine racemase
MGLVTSRSGRRAQRASTTGPRLAAGPPIALAQTKRLLNRAHGDDGASARGRGRRADRELRHAGHLEAMSAFVRSVIRVQGACGRQV